MCAVRVLRKASTTQPHIQPQPQPHVESQTHKQSHERVVASGDGWSISQEINDEPTTPDTAASPPQDFQPGAGPYEKWPVHVVGWWLEAEKLGSVVDLFNENMIDGAALAAMSHSDLDAMMSKSALGERLHAWKVRYNLKSYHGEQLYLIACCGCLWLSAGD